MIKPIETVYKGYRFRSRLEARWAVFFDALGILWEYEKEGFDIDGEWYLPDFYLPHLDLWIEIKPGDTDTWPGHVVFDAMARLVENNETSNEEWPPPLNNFVLLVGNPGKISEYEFAYMGYVFGDNSYLWCECPVCGKIGIEFDGRGSRICGNRCLANKSYTSDTSRLLNAYLKARQARFEHGECPR